MPLTQVQIAAREGKITASRVACLMTGDEKKILNLWFELIGDPAFVPEDFSDNFQVALGECTEPLNLRWFAQKHGPISRVGNVIIHPCGWAAATLDAWANEHHCPVETKHVGGYEKLEEIITRYQPQMHWQMIVTGANKVALSVIQGNKDPVVEFIEKNNAYADELWRRASEFWKCVEELRPPVPLPNLSPPERPIKVYQMNGSNIWAAQADIWLKNKDAASAVKDAEKTLKSLVPEDAMRCEGYGVAIHRDRAGRLSLREHT